MILGAVLVSERLVDPEQRLSQALLMLLIFALTQIIMRVINACTSLLQNQLLVCSRTFVTLRLNAKLLRMGQLASDEFSTGNLKTLISSDIYRISDFLHGISRNGVPCLLGVLLLGPVVVFYMGWPGVIALGLGFAALPLAMVLGRYIYRKEEVIKAGEDKLVAIIGEWVSNVRLLRFLSWEPLMRSRVAHHIRRLVTESTEEHAAVLLGERQLLCIARLILLDKRYVLMDEPTSRLDRRTDERIQWLLRTSLRGRTVITVSKA